MKRFFVLSMLVVSLTLCVVGCSGKETGLEGKVIDGKGQPLANVKVEAKMSQPLKGYEHFETKTGPDGSFKLSKLFPKSEYQLIFYSERWTINRRLRTESAPEGETKILPYPVTIRFMNVKEGIVLDTETSLMWASRDNGSVINWYNAKNYCENYRGGGYTDWRLPTLDELKKLYVSDEYKTFISVDAAWTSETRGSEASGFDFTKRTGWGWSSRSEAIFLRALPVRSVK
jgi:hypothetical protein